jgi:hypothetical protein
LSADDRRRHAPASARNREPILAVLRQILPERGRVLEVASGTGEHVCHFAAALPALVFQPSDKDPEALESVAAWIHASGLTNVLAPLSVDVEVEDWEIDLAPFDALLNVNMIHISPFAACVGLLRGAGRLLAAGSPLCLYGPFKRGGHHTAASNEAFDQSLRGRDARFGVRDLDDVIACANEHGLSLDRVVEMPANNLCVVLRAGG